VCYPGENKFTNAATQWGCDHEKSAINEYLKTMSEAHDNIQVNESGARNRNHILDLDCNFVASNTFVLLPH
jgi:hypothetical protein